MSGLLHLCTELTLNFILTNLELSNFFMYINMLKSTQEAAGAPKPLGERETWSKNWFSFSFYRSSKTCG